MPCGCGVAVLIIPFPWMFFTGLDMFLVAGRLWLLHEKQIESQEGDVMLYLSSLARGADSAAVN